MSIQTEADLLGMQKASYAVAITLKKMMEYAQPGMSTKELDLYGLQLLNSLNAKSAPLLTYSFPGATCISVNQVICHGIPSPGIILKEGDLINIDVSAECEGYWSDNGCSFVLGKDINGHQKLVQTSKYILWKVLEMIRHDVRISDVGLLIETEAKKKGYKVIKNLAGHGIGRSLHESPHDLLNYKVNSDKRKFKKNSVVAIETFIATKSTFADTLADGWTMVGDKGGFMAQHEHTIIVQDGKPIVLTAANGIG